MSKEIKVLGSHNDEAPLMGVPVQEDFGKIDEVPQNVPTSPFSENVTMVNSLPSDDSENGLPYGTLERYQMLVETAQGYNEARAQLDSASTSYHDARVDLATVKQMTLQEYMRMSDDLYKALTDLANMQDADYIADQQKVVDTLLSGMLVLTQGLAGI